MAPSDPLVSLVHFVANLYFVGGLVVSMAVFRELYPGWRAGFVRAIYDLLLMVVGLFFALGVTFYLTSVPHI